MNYFELLQLAPDFSIDLAALEKAYFSAQRASHPDRFIGKPQVERQQAMQRSVDINKAFETLKNPLTRAQYLLHLQGIAIGTDHDTIKPAPQALAETLEWREQVAEAVCGAEITKLESLLNQMYLQSLDTISGQFKRHDWNAMAHETIRLGYLIKAQEALDLQKKHLEKRG